jgi:hypothetical protein
MSSYSGPMSLKVFVTILLEGSDLRNNDTVVNTEAQRYCRAYVYSSRIDITCQRVHDDNRRLSCSYNEEYRTRTRGARLVLVAGK